MKYSEFNHFIDSYHSGTFVRVTWTSRIENAKSKKAGIVVEKTTSATVRMTIKYGHIKAVKARKAAQEAAGIVPKERVSWSIPLSRGLIQHKDDPSKIYVQLYPFKNGEPHVSYTINGKPAHLVEVKCYCNDSKFESKPTSIFNVPLENIKEIIQNKRR